MNRRSMVAEPSPLDENRPIHGGPLLDVTELVVHFESTGGAMGARKRVTKAVDGVSFTIERGEAFGIVGESGSGKTTVARAVLRLVNATSGQIRFLGKDWLELSGRSLRRARRDMQAVFQDPFLSLDPYMTVAANISEPLIVNRAVKGKKAARDVAGKLLAEVGIDSSYLDDYPRQLSGGQRQRVAIARAVASQPELVICDEPLSALDVSVQAQMVNLLGRLKRKYSMAYLFIGHDLSVMRYLCDRVAVMYAGQVVEVGSSEELFDSPRHPYTQLLLSVIPEPFTSIEQRSQPDADGDESGEVPSPRNLPTGCHFHPRCPFATEICTTEAPSLSTASAGYAVACHHWERIERDTAPVPTATRLGTGGDQHEVMH